ncbi:Ig-like domain-containing protein [Flavobacterium sp. SUN046]|uniref:Ig-like domain-containing protein n=1 Tax=Flavobacterium sp. SUN046 TaxID=3002440 RepID=UPI002DBD7AAB|nr:Ig-like domain-containing protein [Flavobacterium sp. SUN046]MEC4048585.1 Ig-like domain-containing protein [Flavobacterium sp. SUN046]
MNKNFTIFLLKLDKMVNVTSLRLLLIISLFIGTNHANAQNAIVGSGFSSGWGSACSSGANFSYFSSTVGGTYISNVLSPGGTGNQYWRMGVDWGGTYKQLNNTGSDQAVTPGTKYTLSSTCTGNGAMFRSVSSASNRYIFKTLNAGTNPTGTWVFFELGAAPVTISSVSQSPITASVGAGQSTLITASLSASLPTGQGVYLRYTNNNYSSSTVVELTGSGTSFSTSIPTAFNTLGTNVNYYLFTSGSGLTISGADADLYTININNNGGSNYNYTVQATPTITLGTSPSICKGGTTANLTYSATTNSSSQYSLVFDSTALAAGFTNVSNATLTSSPIVISVPGVANTGTYNCNLTVKNTTTGVVSSVYPITVTVLSLPTATITANGATTFCSGGSVTLTASSGSSYLWSNGATTSSISATTSGNYTVRVSSANGCSATSSATNVVVNSLPTATITANGATTFCSGGSVTLTASSGSSYLWSNGATTNSINVNTAGNYSVTITDANGCSATSAVKNIIVNALPATSITANGATTFCSGGSVTLTASSGSSYLWSNGATTSSISSTISGNYSVTVTNENGCSATSSAMPITVLAASSSSSTITACDTYTWSVNEQTYTQSGTYTSIGVNEAGCTDTKILNLTIYASTPSSQTISACDSYTWSVNGTTYTSSGTYVFEGTNAAGCSQNQTLYLTINNSTSSSESITACDSYTWGINGQTYTTSGVYTNVSTNAAGCTDTKTLNLTINSSTASSQTVSACDSYTWAVDGTTYTQSGTYTFTSTNAAGCTDIKTLNLTITPSTTATTVIEACGTYTWSVTNQTYSESGTYSVVSNCETKVLELTVIPNTSNTTTETVCDSYTWSVDGNTYTSSGIYSAVSGCHTELLDLTVNHSTASTQTVLACDSYTWSVNSQVYASSGTYTITSTNASGCTDIKTLVLTINSSTSSSQNVTACGSYTWSANGQTYTTSGTHTYTSTNATGCTDTKTLNLIIDSINKSNAGTSWTNGQNDNTIGFGAWNLTTNGGTAGFFTASSDINNGGTASWGMFASGGANVASAVRTVSMGIGNTISFSMDNGFIDDGKTIGFGLQNDLGQNLMELYFVGGQSFYTLNDNAGQTPTSIGYTSSGMDVTITYTALNTYSITIKTKSGATATYTSRTFISQATGQKPAQIRMFNSGAGVGPNYDLFFNSLAINNPVITVQPSALSQNICAGSTVTNLSLTANGSGLTYQWYSNTTNSYTGATSLGNLNGANSNTLTPQNNLAGTLYYYCIVTGPCGATYSNISGAVVVTAPSNAGSISGVDQLCKNGTSTLTTNGTSGGVWTSSNTAIATVSSTGLVSGLGVGTATITYTVNGNGGCSNSSTTHSITVNGLPNATISVDTPTVFCEGGSAVLSASEGTNYLWSNGETSQTISVTISGSYSVEITNDFGCKSTATAINVTVTPITHTTNTISVCEPFTWSENGVEYSESGVYTVVNGCHTAVLQLTINEKINYYIDADADGFDVGTTALCAVTAPVGYALSTNGSDCNDADANVHETTTYYIDADADGFDVGTTALCAVTAPLGYALSTNGSDCNDTDASAHQTIAYYIDADADGFNVGMMELCAATAPVGYASTTNGSDCNDADASVHQTTTYYIDGDSDGFGSNVTAELCSSIALSGYSTNNLDCNDLVYSQENNCNTLLKLKLFLQGYYDLETHAMKPVLANQGVGESETDVDYVTVGLYSADGTLVTSSTGILKTDGSMELNFGSIIGDYYIVISHRNTITTSSTSLVSFESGLVTNYDFTIFASQAYMSNQIVLENGVYALYSGDLNQDGYIDASDFPIFDLDNQISLSNIYAATDLNGDGYVDASDYPIFDSGNQNAVSFILPF